VFPDRPTGIRRIDAATGTIATVAGNGSGRLGGFSGIDLDREGNLYFVANNRIYRKDARTNIVTAVAGNGASGYLGGYCCDDVPATRSRLSYVRGLAADGSGNLFIPDYWFFRVRYVDARTGIITTYAGGGGGRDGAPATGAALGSPLGVALDASGNLLIATGGPGDNRVRKVDAAGIIKTIAGRANAYGLRGDNGPATSALLNEPNDVVVDAAGNLFIADSGNIRIRKVDANGIITTYAGGGERADPVLATEASLTYMRGVAVDAAGNLFIADTGHNRIRRVDASTHLMTTVAGTRDAGYTGDNGPATAATLSVPWGICLDASGNLFIADSGNNAIRVVKGIGQARGASPPR
jgi:DNA-binding beta-propeller fold protein YncE